MSADNGVFIFDHPHGYGVAEETLSAMPACLDRVIKTGRNWLGQDIGVYATYQLAVSAAYAWQRALLDAGMIVEYGIVDWANQERKFRPGTQARRDAKLPRGVRIGLTGHG